MMKLIIFIICFLSTATLQGLMLSQPDVQAAVDQKLIQENQPFQVMISITHDKSDSIDINSFTTDGQKLKVEKDREVEISPNSPIVVTFFQFTLPGKPPGLFALPEIKVKVGNSTYSSISSTYEVRKFKSETQPSVKPQKNESSAKTFLKLELEITGTPLLYPKQRFQVIYKYDFIGNIELSKEQLPLLNPSGFLKVGSKITTEYQEKENSVQQFSQTLQAVKPGEFNFGPSEIQGRAYKTDFLGNRIFLQPNLESSTPPITLHVAPFPAENKPPSFNEAIGPFNVFKVSLASPEKVHVGDKILLKIEIGGDGQVDTVPLPELCCQPGFSGVFQLSDLPPSEQVVGSSKNFMVEMRPLTALVHEIPSISFSYFVPKTGKYGTLKSDPIPIEILPLYEGPKPQPQETSPSSTSTNQPFPNWRQGVTELPSIEIIGNWKLSTHDLYPLPFGSWWLFMILPIGALFLAAEIKIKQLRLLKKASKVITSKDVFEEAISHSSNPSAFYVGMIKAFMLALKEKNVIASESISPEMLQEEGLQGEVRAYLLNLERSLFGGAPHWDRSGNIQKAQELFRKLKSNR